MRRANLKRTMMIERSHIKPREPDLLDELARWLPVVWSVLDLSESFLTGSRNDKRRALIAAEKAVLHLETVEKQQQANPCESAARCAFHRCRRRWRCTKQEQTAALLAAARAQLAAELAKWQPPVLPADPPPRVHKKGRTGVCP